MSSVKQLRNAVFLAVVSSGMAFAQSSPGTANAAPPITSATANLPEISTQEQTPSFQVKVNLVEVRAVVRDAQGKAIGDLKKEDFVLLDDKKPQPITRFSIERNEPAAAPVGAPTSATASDEIRSRLAGSWRLAYLFDDLNSAPNDLTLARKAADQAIDALAPGQLLGIFTLSGQGTQDFTGDKERLHAALAQLKPRPQGASVVSDCPPINYYVADQVDGYNDQEVFKVVVQEIIGCQFDGLNPIDPATGQIIPRLLAEYERATHMAIDRVYRAGEAQSDLIFQSINEIVRHVSQFGGQRTMVLLSPGFYLGKTRQADLTDALNRAIAGGVVVNTLDLRGVLAQSPTGADISQRAYASSVYGTSMIRFETASSLAQADPLMQMANATGGKYFHNSNDLSGGLANLSAPPEFSYLLAFTPQNLQKDGKFHSLQVELKQPSGYTIQARRGYYAAQPGGSNEQVKREIAEAVFAHDEIHELPVRVQTQFFRSGDDSAKVAVLVHVDVRHMQFKKADGRNLNELTIVSALFDRNANLVTAKSSTVQMHIKDDTLETKLN
jgi:VWFA-related protein